MNILRNGICLSFGRWYVVRHTAGVTKFVGSAKKPIPAKESEIKKMGFDITSITVDYEVNDEVRVMAAPFEGYTGTVMEINKEKHIIKASISMFGRETPVELDFTDVEKLK